MNNARIASRRSVKVLNFGSLNLDYVYNVDHFVRAGETIATTGMERFLGGKGLNQSIALARAGATVFHAGAVGGDGEALVNVLNQNHVDTSFVRVVNTPAGHAIIQREPSGQNCIFLYSGANHSITKNHIHTALAAFSRDDYLVLQNEINDVAAIMTQAKERGMHIVFNPSPFHESIRLAPLHLVDIFILNEVEACALCGEIDPVIMLKTLRVRFSKAIWVLTLGEAGIWYQDPQMISPIWQAAYKVSVVDTTAAGDTFTGYFLACISRGEPVKRALDVAARAAALSVSRKGAEPSIPWMKEVREARFPSN